MEYEFSPQLETAAVAKDRASSLVLGERTSPVKKVSALMEDVKSIGKTLINESLINENSGCLINENMMRYVRHVNRSKS